MGYRDDMDQLRKELKKELSMAGIKSASVRKGSGSVYGWTYISKGNKKKGYADWTQNEVKKLNKDFGFHVGHPSNSIDARAHEVAVAVYGSRAKKLKNSIKYKKLKEEYFNISRNAGDHGTVVGGAGTIVKHKGNPIDFWKETQMSETGSWTAENKLKDKIRGMKLEFQHEGGWMD